MLDRFFSCDFQDCDLPSPRGLGPCERCSLRFCSIHAHASHTCETTSFSNDEFATKIRIEIETLREKLNDDAVCKRASELNGGLGCEIEHPPAWGRGALMGCANYHARLRFAGNGSTWLIRVPRVNGSIPQQLIDYLIRSEYATLKFLERTNVPAPRAFGYGIAGDEDNKVGLSYIIIEEMPGKLWNGQGPHGKRFADGKDKEKVWSGLAEILIELKRHPFHQAGSLLPGDLPAMPIVSAIASDRFLVLSPAGPFDTAGEYYTAFVEQILSLIADGQLFPSFPVNAYLVFLYLKSQIGDLSPVLETPARFFFGLDVDLSWDETLLLVRGIWATFGIERDTDWEVWKGEMLKQYGHDERLKRLLA